MCKSDIGLNKLNRLPNELNMVTTDRSLAPLMNWNIPVICRSTLRAHRMHTVELIQREPVIKVLAKCCLLPLYVLPWKHLFLVPMPALQFIH